MLRKKRHSEMINPALFRPESPENFEAGDTLTVEILSLRLHDDPIHFAIKVTFFDQLILTNVINSIGCKDAEPTKTLAKGTMDYDPSDYEKMSIFADCPLVVHIQPLKSIELLKHVHSTSDNSSNSTGSTSFMKSAVDVSCCNVDILSIFLTNEENPKICIKKRMEPLITPSALQRKSWDCLPLLTMEVSASHKEDNTPHYKVLKDANWMKLTLVGSYNMLIPFDDECIYTAASKTQLNHEYNTALATFNQGYKEPRRFNHTSFYPKWETLRVGDDMFTKGDEKFLCRLEDIKNDKNIDIDYYITQKPLNTVLWGSFHRSLILKNSEQWLSNHIRQFKWPLEIHIYDENDGYSFMAFMNLFSLLYPGEDTVRLAVPLQWINTASMMEACNCCLLLTPNEKASSPFGTTQKPSRLLPEMRSPSMSTDAIWPPSNTGADENNAFAIVEVKLKRPLKKRVIPPQILTRRKKKQMPGKAKSHISRRTDLHKGRYSTGVVEEDTNSINPNINLEKNIDDMLKEMEKVGVDKRSCTGRGQLIKDWQDILRGSATALRRVPYYGVTEICAFNRQLSETRTRVELITSCWQEAAVYVNNNFVIQQYLRPDDGKELYEEMLMMVHACLVKIVTETLLGESRYKESDPVLRAARQARQMQDTYHATELYLQVAIKQPNNGCCWRELSTCLKDIDREWANVCLNKAVVLNPRHPLTLISKGGMVCEEDPRAAEIFFDAVLAFYPFWTTAWIIASVYYFYRGQYLLADEIISQVKKSRRAGIAEELGYARSWERELGDWWNSTPILPGTSCFCDAADLLLRLRCIILADICVARMLIFSGESAEYYHLVALCCRLRGDYNDALCHLRVAENKYGRVSYLKSLEAECLHKLDDIPASMNCYEEAGQTGTSYNILMSLRTDIEPKRIRAILVDLVRRQPSAYAWLALADNWMPETETEKEIYDARVVEEHRAAKRCAAACAVEALKRDRRATKAWALLAKLVKPSARRYHCLKMASICGCNINQACLEYDTQSQQSSCYHLGIAITACRCPLCERLRL